MDRVTIPQSATQTAPFAQGGLYGKIFQMCIYKMHKGKAKFSFKMSKREN